jgi:hypothetical protein
MHVQVKLLGALSLIYDAEYPAAGLDLDIPRGSTIEELVEAIGISRERVMIETIKCVPGRADDLVYDNGSIKLIQGLDGG